MKGNLLRRIDYRYYICIGITVGFALLGVFVFRSAFFRLIEAGRDFGLSVAYYFCELFGIQYTFVPTVNELPKDPPSVFLPENWELFKTSFGLYWSKWGSMENFLGYLAFFGRAAKVLTIVLIPLVACVFLFRMLVGRYVRTVNNDYAKESRPLRAFKSVSDVTYRPVKAWLTGFFSFVREHKAYWVTWILMWVYFFNGFTIFLEFFAFYFYFVFSLDFANLYRQGYKLVMDLYPVFAFVPLWAWLIGAVVLFGYISRRKAMKILRYNERRNRNFLNGRGVFLSAFGPPGVGKTLWVTDAALSYEVQILDDALDILMETDMRFPFFPWISLETELRRAAYFHVCYDVWSVKRWIRKKRQRFEKSHLRSQIFGYDFGRYGIEYDDNLCRNDIWQAIEDHALAYFIYTVQSSYLVSNYSIRSDKRVEDLGNLPLWDTDFFARDSRLEGSRYAHILDFDMLRLGKRMFEDNPNRYAYGFGVYVISEIDKERKNAPTLRETKASAKECNQLNDLFNTCMKMSRHACVVANRVFVHIIGDLQRTGSLNADYLELGDTVELREKGEMLPVLPFWAPFWIVELFVNFVLGKHEDFYLQYRHVRGDSTLLMYLVHGLAAKLFHYRERVYNLYGCQKVTVRVARATDEGDFRDCTWYRQSKKVYARRYESDCMSAIFEAHGEMNRVGLDDLREYASVMATAEERAAQNSHFQHDIDTAISV